MEVKTHSNAYRSIDEMRQAYEYDEYEEGFTGPPVNPDAPTWDIHSNAPPADPGYFSKHLPPRHQWILTATEDDHRWEYTRGTARKVIDACNKAPFGEKISPKLEHWAAWYRDKQITNQRRLERPTFDLPGDMESMPPAVRAILKEWHINPRMILPGVAMKKDSNEEETNFLSVSDVDMAAMIRALKPKERGYRTVFLNTLNTAFHNLEPLAPTIDWDRVPKSSCMWYCMRARQSYAWNPDEPPTSIQLLGWVVQTVQLQWHEVRQVAGFLERNASGRWHNRFGEIANLQTTRPRARYRKGKAMAPDKRAHPDDPTKPPTPTHDSPKGTLVSRIRSAQPLSSRLGPSLCEAGPSSQPLASGSRTPLPAGESAPPRQPSPPPPSPQVEGAEDDDDSLYESLSRKPRSRSGSFAPEY